MPLIAILTVTVDEDPKNVLDGILVAVKGGTSQIYATAHFCFQPSLVNLSKRYPPGLADGVHQPNVLLEFCRCLHTLEVCYSSSEKPIP